MLCVTFTSDIISVSKRRRSTCLNVVPIVPKLIESQNEIGCHRVNWFTIRFRDNVSLMKAIRIVVFGWNHAHF